MIVVDNKELNISNPQSYNEKWVAKWIKEFKESKRKEDGTHGTVTLLDLAPINKNRLVFKPPRRFDIAAEKINPETGVKEYWMVCQKRPTIRKNGEKYYPKLHWGFFRQITLTVDDNIELILFLTQIVNIQQFGFVVENKQEKAKQKLDARKAEYEVGNWINNKCTPEEIIKLSYRWGLDPVDKSDEELRDELFDRIRSMESSGDKKRGYKSFIEEMNSDSEIMKTATYFYKAVHDKKIAFNPSNRTCYWADTSEIIGGVIPPVRFAKDKEEYIIDYLHNDPKELELFMRSIEGEVDKIAADIGDYNNIKNPAKLRGWMKTKTGFDIGLVSLEDGRAKIAEFFEKNPVKA